PLHPHRVAGHPRPGHPGAGGLLDLAGRRAVDPVSAGEGLLAQGGSARGAGPQQAGQPDRRPVCPSSALSPRDMRTVLLLVASNVFMTVAWYGHLRFRGVALWKVILASWGIAFFEYCLQVPANRWGYGS